MRSRPAAITLVVMLAAACAGGSSSQPALQSSSPPGPTAPAAASATANASNAPASALEGTWATPETTCEQQNAALTKAGFTADDLDLGGWDSATCGAMMHGSQFKVRFAGERLLIFLVGAIGWDGTFQIVGATRSRPGTLPGATTSRMSTRSAGTS